MVQPNAPPASADPNSGKITQRQVEPNSKVPEEEKPASAIKTQSEVTPSKSTLELAWAEWELVQQKIDNVSTFPFTVKTWSVTVSAALLGLAHGLDFPRSFLIASLIVPFVFKAVESRHNQVRDTLSKRAEKLELLIAELAPLNKGLPENFPGSLRREISRLPGVALSIIREAKSLQRQDYYWEKWSRHYPLRGLVRNIIIWWDKCVTPRADLCFLWGQVFLI
jgi:hypothetical protein